MTPAGRFFRPSTWLIGCSLLLFSACVNDPEDVARLQQQRIATNMEVAKEVEIYWSDSAKVRVIAVAPTMHNFVGNQEERQEFPDGLHITFFDEFQDTSSTLIAKWGVYRRRTNEITVRDSVVWESVDLQRLETEELNWEEKSERIYTNKFVVLRQPDYLITGYGLEADQTFTNATVLQVDGRIPLNRPE
ncbi:MAG: LPS export ABC transporter periplasmic protein LptC [Bacteroidota bacterium]